VRGVDLLRPALGLNSPWIVRHPLFDAERRRLDITIDFTKGSLLPCSGCGKPHCPTHDTVLRLRRQAGVRPRARRITFTCGMRFKRFSRSGVRGGLFGSASAAALISTSVRFGSGPGSGSTSSRPSGKMRTSLPSVFLRRAMMRHRVSPLMMIPSGSTKPNSPHETRHIYITFRFPS